MSKSSKELYILLGVDPAASFSDIRRAFQKLARKYHPDINPGDRVSAIRYQGIRDAFLILSDKERRAEYDRAGGTARATTPVDPPRYGFEGFDFSIPKQSSTQTFKELFRVRPAPQSEGPLPGEDIHHRLVVSFADSMRGISREVKLTRARSCGTCLGWGEVATDETRTCSHCGGRGRTTQARGHMLFAKPCTVCAGAGAVARAGCDDCGGVGQAVREETVTVELAAGVSDGMNLVLVEEGHQGRGGGANGDLHLHIQVESHDFFERRGDNLYCSIPVSFSEAALGAKIPIPTFQGNVKVRVPAGVQSGQQLRLSGRGAPSLRGNGFGDLFVQLRVVTPQVYDDRSRKLLEELDRLNPFSLRESSVEDPDVDAAKAVKGKVG